MAAGEIYWSAATGAPDPRVAFRLVEPALSLEDMVARICKPIERGELIPDDLFPKVIENQTRIARTKQNWVPGRRLPHFFFHDLFCVSNEAITVLRDADLGAAQMAPVRFFGKGMVDEVEEPVEVLMPCNPKTAFLHEASPKVMARLQGIPALTRAPQAKADLAEDDVAVSAAALEGPEVWVDPTYRRTCFFSGRLVDALRAAGLAEDFRFRRTRVI